MKRILALMLAALLAVALISCSAKDETNDGAGVATDAIVAYENVDLVAVADSLYDGIAEDERPFVMSMPIEDEEMFGYFTFIPYEEGLEAVANEPMMSSIAHSIVLVKAPTVEKAEEVAAAMKANCDPRKWMCVEADIVEGLTNGNIAMLLMTTKEGGMADTIIANFNALDAEKIASLKSEIFFDDEPVEDEIFLDDEAFEDEFIYVDLEDEVTVYEEESDAEGELFALADKLYEGIDPENMPMVGTMELTEENFEYSAFVPYKSSYLAVESMPMMGSQPHSVVIVKTDSEEDAAILADEMLANANPRKWICVQARSVKSAAKGNYAILVMTSVEVMPVNGIDEAQAEEMSEVQSEERADIIINNFLANV